MKLINRESVQIPNILISDKVKRLNSEIEYSYKINDFERIKIPEFYSLKDEIIEDLISLFNGKCAYCETKISYKEFIIDHFRPMSAAEDSKGKIKKGYYTWLAFDWENIYLSCKECNMLKRNLFPIIGRRGSLLSSIKSLRVKEKTLLIDSCFDLPEEHLFLNKDGTFSGRTKKGRTTISIFRLNRVNLLENRLNILRDLKYIFLENDESNLFYELERIFLDEIPFLGTVILFLYNIAKLMKEDYNFNGLDDQNELLSELKLFTESFYRKRDSLNLSELFNDRYDISSSYEEYYEENIRQAYYIKKVTIRNFKSISKCELFFPNNLEKGISSKAFIGKNTIGKTSILQAISLAILGPREANKIFPDASEFLNKDVDEGFIEIEFWQQKALNRISFKRGSKKFIGEENTSALLLAYGSYRLAAKRQLSINKRLDNYRIASLFDERELINGPLGLVKRHSKYEEDIAATISTILDDENVKVMFDSKNGLRISHNGHELKLDKFSSGYQSVISFVTDIMDVLYTRWNSMEGAQGIVLIDELDAHLHPEWKFKISSALRKTFPYVQFIFTTHDPLILKGMLTNEISVLKRDESGEVFDSGETPPIIDSLGIDQLLTSAFGMKTTISPNIESMFNRYYSLLSKHQDQLTNNEKNELKKLEENLSNSKVFGNTKRERLFYQLIDKELSKENNKSFNEWSKPSVDEFINRILKSSN